MPLTSHSTALDDIEMTKRIAETLRQRSMEASKMGIDGLSTMEKMAAQARGETRQAGLDKQASQRLVLQDRRQTASDTRQSRLDAATKAERESTKLRLEKTDTAAAQKATEAANWQMSEAGRDQGNRNRQFALDEKKLRLKRAPASPEAGERQRVKDELAKQQLENAKAVSHAKGRPTVKDAEDVTELDRALAEANRLAKESSEVETGTFANARNTIAQMIDVDDPRVTQFKASVGEQLAQYISSISGATVPESERTILMQNVPTMNDGNDAFVAKLDRVISMLGSKRSAKVGALNAAGKDTSGLAPPATDLDAKRKRQAELAAKAAQP